LNDDADNNLDILKEGPGGFSGPSETIEVPFPDKKKRKKKGGAVTLDI